MAIYTIPGLKYPVSVETIEGYASLGGELADKALTRIVLAGGAMTINLKKEEIEAQLSSPNLTPAWREMIESLQPGIIIVVLDSWLMHLTKAEQMAILYHEEGHIENGDIVKLDKFLSEYRSDGEFRIFENTESEILADAYAAERVGKINVLSSLIKLLQFTAKAIAETKKIDFEEQYSQMVNSDCIQKRIKALVG